MRTTVSMLLVGAGVLGCGGHPLVEPSTQASPAPEPHEPFAATPSEPWPCPEEGDVDGDGRLDRVSLSLGHAEVRIDAGSNLVVPLPPAAVTRLCLADVDADARAEIVATVIRPTRGDETFRQRVFMYEVEGLVLRPRLLATRGAGELLHVGLLDVDGDGRAEILARERDEAHETTRVYGLEGYGLRENLELRDAAPPYGFHLPSLERIDFGGELERQDVFRDVPTAAARTVGRARSVTVSKGLSNVVNRGDFRWLSQRARRRLEEHGFVVIEPNEPPGEMHELYIENQYLGLPSFITTDTALHFTHLVVDDVLQDVEEHLLGPALVRLVDGMRWQAEELAPRLPPGLAEPLSRVQLRLDIAAALLKGETLGLVADRARAVETELAHIEGHGGAEPSQLGIDPTIFVVRGHYTKTASLARYFKAHLLLSTSMTTDSREAALLTALAISDPAHRHLLGLIDGFARAFVGPPANRTPLELLPAARATFGPAPDIAQLDGSDTWARPGQRADTAPSSEGITLLARRWPADNDVLSGGRDRGELPSALELLVALGSARARTHLADRIEANPGLEARLERASEAGLQGRIGDPHSVGGRWLLALRWVLLPFEEGYPTFLRSPTWADHAMVTAAASWAELRRDTILYVQPPVVWMEGGDEDALPPGEAAYVEPTPELYQALSEALSGLERLLSRALGSPTDSSEARGRGSLTLLRSSRELLELFEAAARRELDGEDLTTEQHERLRSTGEFLEATLAGAGTLRLDPVPVIADVVHQRDPDSGAISSMLMAATGTVDVIVVAVPLGRRVVLARGPVLSFYSFESPRLLTDDQWRQMLEEGAAPPRPSWGSAIAGPARSTRLRSRPRPRLRNRTFD